MFSLRANVARRAPRAICTQCYSLSRPLSAIALKASLSRPTPSPTAFLPRSSAIILRTYADKSSADAIMEKLQDQYATARDEFEIAAEETEKKTVYAADDREAARTELDVLRGLYEEALGGADGEEVKKRIGGRLRELENAVEALEESAIEH
ncbi:hypothetical protein LHYA1_G005648 [Lachnellula hyalina]|uniref:Uncharacterized protein n=1 Tax=Lachnellula hyalina TaxID=1316788 RepID=A0A8H8TYB9_9HELO|nr:uncharacterized protein LHYA1_G005648 [Lachnellula hyalina]TVY24757.1 hypothetical protein LHYA1_G005648 [Lachnellula hyalina]